MYCHISAKKANAILEKAKLGLVVGTSDDKNVYSYILEGRPIVLITALEASARRSSKRKCKVEELRYMVSPMHEAMLRVLNNPEIYAREQENATFYAKGKIVLDKAMELLRTYEVPGDMNKNT